MGRGTAAGQQPGLARAVLAACAARPRPALAHGGSSLAAFLRPRLSGLARGPPAAGLPRGGACAGARLACGRARPWWRLAAWPSRHRPRVARVSAREERAALLLACPGGGPAGQRRACPGEPAWARGSAGERGRLEARAVRLPAAARPARGELAPAAWPRRLAFSSARLQDGDGLFWYAHLQDGSKIVVLVSFVCMFVHEQK